MTFKKTKRALREDKDERLRSTQCITNTLSSLHTTNLNQLQEALKAGDVVKIDMGCQIDGYITVAAHTMIVPAGVGAVPEILEGSVIGDVAVCAYQCMLAAVAMIKPGNTNTMVTAAVQRVCDAYGVKAISNMRMHQMKRFVIDGKKEIALRALDKDEEKVEEATFEVNEVYAVDIAISSGEGRGRESGRRTTIFKRNVDTTYRLKMKNSRAVLNEVNAKYSTMPFSLRMIEDEKVARMGIAECTVNNLLASFPVFCEKDGAQVGQFKTTVLLMPNGTTRVCGLDMPAYFTSEKTASEEDVVLINSVTTGEAEKKAKADKKKAQKKKAAKKN
jgi:curved DNA binding protein